MFHLNLSRFLRAFDPVATAHPVLTLSVALRMPPLMKLTPLLRESLSTV